MNEDFEKFYKSKRDKYKCSDAVLENLRLYLDDDDNIVYNEYCKDCKFNCKQHIYASLMCKKKIKVPVPIEYVENKSREQIKQMLLEAHIIDVKGYTKTLNNFIRACYNEAEFKPVWHDNLKRGNK